MSPAGSGSEDLVCVLGMALPGLGLGRKRSHLPSPDGAAP